MFEVLPSGNPVILCFGWWFWEVVLKVIRIDVSKNVPQHLAVLYVLPALYLLGRLKCLHLAMSAGSNEMLLRTVVPISAGLLPTPVGPRLPCRSNDGDVVWRMMCRQVYRSQTIMLSGTRRVHCNQVLCQKLNLIHPRVRGIHMTRTCQAVRFRGLVESPKPSLVSACLDLTRVSNCRHSGGLIINVFLLSDSSERSALSKVKSRPCLPKAGSYTLPLILLITSVIKNHLVIIFLRFCRLLLILLASS